MFREKPPLRGLEKPGLATFLDEGLKMLGYLVDEKCLEGPPTVP